MTGIAATTGRGIVACLIAASLSVVAAAPASAGGANADPDVYTRALAGPVTVPLVSIPSSPLVTLHVPNGRWVVWAKLTVLYGGMGSIPVDCSLGAGLGLGTDVHRGATKVGALGDPDAQLVSLSVSIATGQAGTEIRLRCTSPYVGATARHMRIVAMRAGTLKRRSFQTGQATTDGNASPRVVQGYDSGEFLMPDDDQLQTSVSLPLGAGRWWVRASFTVQAEIDPGTPIGFRCRLVLGTERDDVDGWVTPKDFEGDRQMLTFDVAGRLDAGASAKTRCASEWPESILMRDIRMTAVKVGGLTLAHAVIGGATTSSGRGSPHIRHGSRPGLVAVDGSFWSTIGVMDLPAGTWLLMGKVGFVDGPSELLVCRLISGSDADYAYRYFPFAGGSRAFEVGHAARTAGEVRVQCRQPTDPGERALVANPRITAIKLGGLTVVR